MISTKGLDLILEFEVGGSDGAYYNKYLKTPTVPAWQTTRSGATIGIGYDCAYNSPAEIQDVWEEFLPDTMVKKLKSVSGLTGSQAYHALSKVKGVSVTWEQAKKQFHKYTVPRFYKLAQKRYTNFDVAPQAIKDALVSLTFNRGTSFKGSSRQELVEIDRLMGLKQWGKISEQFRSMKRLWPNVKGLLRRRDAEAAFIDQNL